MVIDFLNNLRSGYFSEKLDLESEQKNYEIKLNENKKVVQKLEEEEEKNYNAFSPRKQNTNLKDRIHKLNLERESLLKESEEIEKKINDLDIKIKEIDDVLENTKQQFSDLESEINSVRESESSIAMRNLYIKNLTGMIYKLDFCSKLVKIDPVRCKIELSSISKLIRDTIDEIYTVDLKRVSNEDSED